VAETELIGKGWTFPVAISGGGGIALSSDTAEIDESIALILETVPGERVMRPNFGCRIHELAFAPLNESTLGLVEQYVREALGWWEPRIEVNEVLPIEELSDPRVGRLVVSIKYTIRSTHDERSLVYPFYLIREEQQ
jgi:phage baseplate assembly protein W